MVDDEAVEEEPEEKKVVVPLPVQPAAAAAAEKDGEKPQSDTMPTEEWLYRRVMKPSGLVFAKELEHELMIQPSKRGRGSGSTNGGGGGGGGGNGTHVTLDAAQMAEWRQALGVFGSVGQIVEWADTMRRVVSRIDDDAAAARRAPPPPPQQQQQQEGSPMGRIIREQLARAFDFDMAMEQYARMCATDPSMDDETRQTKIRGIVGMCSASLTGHNNMVGVPLDGVDSYWLEFSFLHPMVLSRVAMPHMTPPIDRASDVYLELWRQVGQPEFPGRSVDCQEFYDYVLATRGTTVDYLDEYDLMKVIDGMTAAFSKKAAKLAQRPAELEAAAFEMAAQLDEAAAVAIKMPEGLAPVLETVRIGVSSGKPMADWLHRLSIWPNSGGSSSSLDRWYSFLMSHWHAADQMVSQYPVALAISTAMANLTGSPPDDPMNFSAVVDGPPGCGKTFIGPTVLQHCTRSYKDLGHKSSMADTTNNEVLGGVETMDEVRLSELSNEHAANMRETYEFIRSGGYIARSHNFSNTRSSTSSKNGTFHLSFDEKGNRVGILTVANKQYAKIYFSNAPNQSIPEPVARRIGTYTLATFSGVGVPTQMTVGHVDTRMRAETKSAKIEDRRSQVQAFDLLALANVLSRTGLLPVTCVAALKVYELASGSMTRFIQAGPRLKLGKWFLPSVTLLEAMMDVGAGIYEPDPTVVFRPFADTLRAYRMLTYITETAAAKAFDLTLGRWTTQVYHAGMPIVCQRLRHLILYESDESGAVVDRHLSSVGFGAVPSHTRYVALRSYFAGVSRDPIERAKFLAVALYCGRHASDWTLALPDVQVLIFILMRGPPCPLEDPTGRERPLPTLHCQAGDDLVVLREFLYDEMVDDRRTVLARAFPPGTVSLMARTSLEPVAHAPSTLQQETMSREERAALIHGSTFTQRNHRVELAREKVVAELLRRHSVWTKRHTDVGAATLFVDAYMEHFCNPLAPKSPDQNEMTRFFTQCRMVAAGLWGVPHLAPKQKEKVVDFMKDSVQMWGECGQLIQATRDFQAKLKELNDGRNADPRLAERHWAEARVCNPRRMHEDHVQAQVEVGNMSADALDMAREEAMITLDPHIFDKAAREHVQMYTSICTDEAYDWCAARPEHRQMLVSASQRYLASLGALRAALRDFRVESRNMSRVVRATCRFALDYAVFQRWNKVHGGLVYEICLATVAQKARSPSGWNLLEAAMKNADRFEEAGVSPHRVMDFIIQTVLQVTREAAYPPPEEERGEDEDARMVPEHGGDNIPMEIRVRAALTRNDLRIPGALRAGIHESEVRSSADLRHQIVLAAAFARSTLFREPIPRLPDGRVIDTYAPTPERQVLLRVTLRRRAALQRARDAVVLRLTHALEGLLCQRRQPRDAEAARWEDASEEACAALDAEARAIVLTWHSIGALLIDPAQDSRLELATDELRNRPDAAPYPTVAGRDFPAEDRALVMQILGVHPLPPLDTIPVYEPERVREFQNACDPDRPPPAQVPAPAPMDGGGIDLGNLGVEDDGIVVVEPSAPPAEAGDEPANIAEMFGELDL